MPSIRTVVSDLYHNRVKGVGGGFTSVSTGVIRESATLSAPLNVSQNAQPVRFSFGLNSNFSMLIDVDKKDYAEANGFALMFEDGKSTLATINRAHRIVAGGGYSGCMYSVYSAGLGNYKCIHTARPGGANPDRYLVQLRQYAAAQNWNLIHEIPTAGLAGNNGCVTTFFLTRVSYNVHPVMVRTVRLQLDARGVSVGRHRWSDQG